MTDTSDLIEQQILKHEVHLKHIDELFAKTERVTSEPADPLLTALKSERDQLEALLNQMRGEAKETWQEAAERHFGPVAVWEALARVLERTIEAHEKSTKS
jgi:hypothetical protein